MISLLKQNELQAGFNLTGECHFTIQNISSYEELKSVILRWHDMNKKMYQQHFQYGELN